MKIGAYETHPAADLFPLMEGEELKALADDIKKCGLRQPVMLYQGKVLDGRNRLLACEKAGVEPRTATWFHQPGASPIAYVVSANLHRRHLDASQRARIAADLVSMFEAEAKERAGTRTDLRADLPAGDAGRARDKAAEAVNVSPRLVADALVVKREGTPEMNEAVKAGKVAVSTAAKEIKADRINARYRNLGDGSLKPSFVKKTRAKPWLKQGITEMAKAIVAGRTSSDVRALIKKLTELIGE